ncbi:MAG: excinuclease ABC subunit A [Myxococcales bacterium]|nr:excinuclease ABC subunit A [Myxococcales bacterium]
MRRASTIPPLPPAPDSEPRARRAVIGLRNVHHHNLKGFDLDVPTGRLTVVTGVSGSGKSTLAFDVLYAEGQRRYVECLSAYARQFVERMEAPQCDAIVGILPAVGLRQGRSIRAARTTVGSLTELQESFRLLFAAAATPRCPRCGGLVARARTSDLADRLLALGSGRRLAITFRLPPMQGAGARSALESLQAAGWQRAWRGGRAVGLESVLGSIEEGAAAEPVYVLVDRLALEATERPRLLDSLQQALQRGGGAVVVWVHGALPVGDLGPFVPGGAEVAGFVPLRAATGLQCAACGLEIEAPSSLLFSPASAVGACPECKGFGRFADVDWERVVPDATRSLAEGAIRPWRTESTDDEFEELEEFCARRAIPWDQPWATLTAEQRTAVLEGEGTRRGFGGVRAWFRYLEARAYKMHVRVLLARYRVFRTCNACAGSRLRPEAQAWCIDGLSLPAWLALPVREVGARLLRWQPDDGARHALRTVLPDLARRVAMLAEVGLHYLTLDRAARTLSGGELQRVQLVAALATGLTQVLYVLDEPSVGLHARDTARLIGILQRLKAAGNTVVVVEHDPELVLHADHVVDLGPGAGAAGGALLYAGPPSGLATAPGSVTAEWLSGTRKMGDGIAARAFAAHRTVPRRAAAATAPQWLTVRAPTARNLQGEDVSLRLGALNVVCGVSGSGKSTLVEDVLYRGLLRLRGEPTDVPGACAGIDGADAVREVVLVDQESPGGSSRANCATYLKVWDAVRARLAAEPLALARGYGEATFSFNKEGGRCPVCEGLGVEIVEMQFLSDVRLTCEACEGRRFRADVLEVRHRGLSAADFLDRTVAEVADLCADDPGLRAPLDALGDLGLPYLRLGQPLSTLSGGEAQRVKIAWHLLQARTRKALFLLDEPSTGLHLHDVDVLLGSLRRLVEAGNTVVLVEHHLELIASADHVVELGPDGGPDGGHVLFAGPPAELAARLDSPTALYLRRSRTLDAVVPPVLGADDLDPGVVQVRGARVHNLRNLDLDLPRDRFVVVTGLSGSGKTSLAFDVVFQEGQRRFLDTLAPFARQYLPPAARPDVDRLTGLPPTVAIAQRTTRGSARSTVATLVDVWPYLRLLWARCGEQVCPTCDGPVSRQDPADIAAAIEARFRDLPTYVLAPVVRGRKGHHSEVIERARGLGLELVHIDGALCPIEAAPNLRRHTVHDIDYVTDRILPGAPQRLMRFVAAVDQALRCGDGTVVRARTHVGPAVTFSVRRHCPNCDAGVEPPDPRLFAFTTPHGWCPACTGTGVQESEGDEEARLLRTCAACAGVRLGRAGLAVRVGGRTLGDVAAMGPAVLLAFLGGLALPTRDAAVAAPILREVDARCRFLGAVGLDYLALGRGAVTLSGGESQRLRLAAQLSSNLTGVLYVLDEPTIGLHPADHAPVLDALDRLVARGNGLLIVEHDEATIRRAHHVVELGPGGGRSGGALVANGPLADLLANPRSPTGLALRVATDRRVRPLPRPVPAAGPWIALDGAHRNNLQHVSVRLPRGRFTAVTGVSGSGKSTLVRDLLVGIGQPMVTTARRGVPGPLPPDAELVALTGLAGFGRIVEVDQSPIGRTPRSCPATYLGVFDALRELYASLPEAKVRGLGAAQFSFNVDGGRCEACAGAGQTKVELALLPAVFVPCDVCQGTRYGEAVLRVHHRDRSIADVLALSFDEALDPLGAVPAIAGPLRLAVDLGLGYLTLGQGSHTLSGGEAQRIKLAAELGKRRRTETLYVLDEPSTGLHLHDVRRLLGVLHALVDRGDTLVVIEHQMDIVTEADWVVDLGPGAGARGGQVGWQGSVDAMLRQCPVSATAAALAGLRGRTLTPAG